MSELSITHYFGGGVYAKETFIPAGWRLMKHVHPDHDHLSILASGTVNVLTNEGVETYDGPACIVIKAGIEHEVVSVTNAVWFCCHATDETDPAKIDEVLIA